MKSMDNSVQMLEWNVKFWAQCQDLVPNFSFYISLCTMQQKSQNADKKVFVGFMMTGL